MTDQRHYPECAVAMENTSTTAEGVGNLYTETERDGGVLERLAVGYQTLTSAFLCPDRGLSRLCADLSE